MFERHYSLEEAASTLPIVRKMLESAQGELEVLEDQIILYKRMFLAKEEDDGEPSVDMAKVLEDKCEQYEACLNKWHKHFAEQGIILRDVDKGLIDFPYKSSAGEEFFLCWHLKEDALLYFHPVDTGYASRQPITLLPD